MSQSTMQVKMLKSSTKAAKSMMSSSMPHHQALPLIQKTVRGSLKRRDMMSAEMILTSTRIFRRDSNVRMSSTTERNCICFAQTPLRPKPTFEKVTQKGDVDKTIARSSDETAAKESMLMVQAARALMQQGDVLKMKIIQEKRSGYLVRHVRKSTNEKGEIESSDSTVVTAFLPTSQLNRETVAILNESSTSNDESAKRSLIGETVDVLITVAEMTLGKPRIIVSERAARGKAALKSLQEGQICYGIVTGLTDFGAFVALKDKRGDFNGAEGLVHISEISWDRPKHPSEKLSLGQPVDVSILSIDLESKKITLSLKNLERDPLKETIDSVMADDDVRGGELEDGESNSSVIEGFDEICNLLFKYESIGKVEATRFRNERHVVSQRMEIYLKTEKVDDGFNIIIREGRSIQEAHVSTTLSRDEMKKVLSEVASGVDRV